MRSQENAMKQNYQMHTQASFVTLLAFCLCIRKHVSATISSSFAFMCKLIPKKNRALDSVGHIWSNFLKLCCFEIVQQLHLSSQQVRVGYMSPHMFFH